MAVPIEAYHNRLQVFGYRINDFVYLTDVKSIPEEEISKLIGVKLLVINALKAEPHHSHFSLHEALEFVGKVRPERAFFTHISHLMGFHQEVDGKLPNGVHLAYDNLVVTL